MDRRERDLTVLHVVWVVTTAALLAMLPVGVAMLLAVIGYELTLLLLARLRGDGELTRLWWYAATLSVWQLLPDQILAEVVGSLAFPPDGVADIGAVSLPMAGMWAVPTVVVVTVADGWVRRRAGDGAGPTAAALTAVVVFAGAELVLPLLGVWAPVGVATTGSLAHYILPAEVLLGVLMWLGWRTARARPAWVTPLVTGLVALAYTGATVTSWLVLA